jgi:hypothetical protein
MDGTKEAAVARLGEASAASRSETAALDARGRVLARTMAEDLEFLHSIPDYARIHDAKAGRLDAALDGVWPRSSPVRPATAAEALARCEEAAGVLSDPLAEAARRLAALPPGDAPDRIRAEGRQVLLIDERLVAAGVDPLSPGSTAVGRAAVALDALNASLGIQGREAAATALGEARARVSAFAPVAPAIRLLAELSGIPGATASQVGLLARNLASAPTPWSPALEPDRDLDEALRPLLDEVSRRDQAVEEAAALDGAYGAAWRSEEPGRLEAASRILASPDDPRAAKATAFAAGIGCTEPVARAARTLSVMAHARLALRRAWPPACLEDVAGIIPDPLAGDPAAALAYLREAAAWRSAVSRTETLRRFHAALSALPPDRREDLRALSPAIGAAMSVLPADRLDDPATGLAEALSAEAIELERHVSGLAAFSDADCAAARRPSLHVRERRAAIARLAAEDLVDRMGLGSPETVPAALAWAERARAILPEGIDPCGRYAAKVLEHARDAVVVAGELIGMRARSESRSGESDPARLVAAGRAALAGLRLADARREVDSAGAWDLVAWLEVEGIEPELWGDALASRREAEPAEVQETGIPAPAVRPAAPVLMEARAWPSAAPGTPWRKFAVAPPQAALGGLTLAIGSV